MGEIEAWLDPLSLARIIEIFHIIHTGRQKGSLHARTPRTPIRNFIYHALLFLRKAYALSTGLFTLISERRDTIISARGLAHLPIPSSSKQMRDEASLARSPFDDA